MLIFVVVVVIIIIVGLSILGGVITWQEHKSNKPIKSSISKRKLITNSIGAIVLFIVLGFTYKFFAPVIKQLVKQPDTSISVTKDFPHWIKGEIVNQKKQGIKGAYIYLRYADFESKKFLSDSNGNFLIPIKSRRTKNAQLFWGYKTYKEQNKYIPLDSNADVDIRLLVIEKDSVTPIHQISSIIITSNLSRSINDKIAYTLNQVLKRKHTLSRLNITFTYTTDCLKDFNDNTSQYDSGGKLQIIIGQHSFKIDTPQLKRVQRKDAILVKNSLDNQVEDFVARHIAQICNRLKTYAL